MAGKILDLAGKNNDELPNGLKNGWPN